MHKQSLLERIYRSPAGRVMSSLAWMVARFQRPFMVYGYYDIPSHTWHKYTQNQQQRCDDEPLPAFDW